jgi:L-histidine Nalpha-methyltransferase
MAVYGDTISKRPSVVTLQEEFRRDVILGLSSNPKRLLSKYFYDETGDKLFHLIMQQPEYYLTCAEHEILQSQGNLIFSYIACNNNKLRIIEPGAGDGLKTKLLIERLIEAEYNCIYNPIDISSNVLDILCKSIQKTYPQVICEPIAGDYLNLNDQIYDDVTTRLMLFLGSNIGNYPPAEGLNILQKFSDNLHEGDYFLLGIDLVKDPARILAAYNDANGVTAQFNYNLLNRINNELGADFLVKNFFHYPVFNPLLQQAESYLISLKKQIVKIPSTQQRFYFEKWEPVLTEISRKYTFDAIDELAENSGFEIINNFFDTNQDFCCSLWRKKSIKV